MIKPPSVYTSESYANMYSELSNISELITSSYTELWNGNVAVATLSNITLQGLQTIDDYNVQENDIVLVKEQSNNIENGYYFAKVGSWIRTTMPILKGSTVFVLNGTNNQFLLYVSLYTSEIGVDPVIFAYVQQIVYSPDGYDFFGQGGPVQYKFRDNFVAGPGLFISLDGLIAFGSSRLITRGVSRIRSLGLPPSGVTAGTYSNPIITINNNGVITNIQSGPPKTAPGQTNEIILNVNNVLTTYSNLYYQSNTLYVPEITCTNLAYSNTITYPNSPATPGSYTNANVTIDANGKILNVTSGNIGSPGGLDTTGQYNNNSTFEGSQDITINPEVRAKIETLKYGYIGSSTLINGFVSISFSPALTNYKVLLTRKASSTVTYNLGFLTVENKSNSSFDVVSYSEDGILKTTDFGSFDYCIIK